VYLTNYTPHYDLLIILARNALKHHKPVIYELEDSQCDRLISSVFNSRVYYSLYSCLTILQRTYLVWHRQGE
jgi:hypothetical protein